MSIEQDHQNQQGLNRIRERYAERARTVIGPEFRSQWLEWQALWNRDYPAYQIGSGAAPEDLDRSSLVGGLVLPRRLQELLAGDARFMGELGASLPVRFSADRPLTRDEKAFRQLQSLASEACKLWPRRHYQYRHGRAHPCLAVASAALIYRHETVLPRITFLLPAFTLELQRLPVQPSPTDPGDLAYLQGQVEYLLDQIRRMVHGDTEWLEEIVDESEWAGRKNRREQGYDKEIDDKQAFWYLPIPSVLTTSDLRKAESLIVRQIRESFGTNTFDEEVRSLAAGGQGASEIAALLGVKQSTIRRVLDRPAPSTDATSP